MADAWDKASARAKETSERALDRVAETAQAFAKNQSGTPVVITGTGGPQIISSSDAQSSQGTPAKNQKTCPNCGQFVDADSKHCEHCGHKFEGV